jgi:tetratricopeptide (TPR) repeat protein
VSLPRLFISIDENLDYLAALEFGRTQDGQPEENWRPVGSQLAYLHTGPAEEAPAVGFLLTRPESFDPYDPEVEEIWEEPHFAAPQLGLEEASAGEVILAAAGVFDLRPTLNRLLFETAVEESGTEALRTWWGALQSGEPMAHFALGYTLYELERFHEAYRHLRYYRRIAPAQPWTHCWFGKAAAAIGEIEEAKAAYERAIELTDEGAEETEAPELLVALEERVGRVE